MIYLQSLVFQFFAKAGRLDPVKLASAKAKFDEMEKAGIVRRSNSAWSSKLHMVP